MVESALSALDNLFSCPCALGIIPHRIAFLFVGVIIGLVLGVVPGMGGLTGLAILLPFTFDMDAYAAMAILIGLLAVTQTSDTIPSVLFAVPGTVGSQATILDGHAMAKKGEAGRAFGAAYMASMFGGLFGALVLALSIPILRPVALAFATPEFFMMGVMGISMVAVLSGRAPIKGLVAGCLGLLAGMIGTDHLEGIPRWVFGQLYLWEGLPLVAVSLGLFAIPEIVNLSIGHSRISQVPSEAMKGVLTGIKDAFRHWFLALRCSAIGVWLGFIPGMGAHVIDWFAYGHAAQTEKGAQETFGKGDVRGVIAPESANNAKDGGGLIPTIAFGIPGGPATALLLGAFIVHGLVPGPDLLTKRLDITYTMIWSLAIANVIGTGLCLAVTSQIAKITTLRIHIITPLVITVVFLAAFQSTAHVGDLVSLLLFSMVGWFMKSFGWPRPPFILGFVLSGVLEARLFVAIQAHGFGWLSRPMVWVIAILTLFSIGYGLFQNTRDRSASRKRSIRRTFKIAPGAILTLVIVIVLLGALITASSWPFQARVFPWTIAFVGVFLCLLQMISDLWVAEGPARKEDYNGIMDLGLDSELTTDLIVYRAMILFGWIFGYFGAVLVIGFVVSTPLFVWLFLTVRARETWSVSIGCTALITALLIGVFHYLLNVAWPQGVIAWPERMILQWLG